MRYGVPMRLRTHPHLQLQFPRQVCTLDFLFKKPFDLSDTVEFMFGVGPEWEHVVTRGSTTDTVAAEAALDFMFWPWADRKFGLYLEPSYDYGFAHGHEQSVTIAGGLLIPIP